MPIIYVDRLFLLNLTIDYLLCLLSARVCGLVLKRGRYVLAALLGALYAILTLLPGFLFLAGRAGKLGAALLMALIAYGGERKPLRCGAVFLCVSAAFGGGLYALSAAGGRPVFDPRVLILSFALCYAGLRLLFYGRAKLPDQPRAEICVRLGGRESRFMALLDSGNRLCDPATGAAVMLACPHALEALFPGVDLGLDAVSLAAQPALAGRFRLIPYRAVGASGLLPVFRPEALSVAGEERQDLLVAVSLAAQGEGFEGIV
ncbi:MAG: sigma-E processing peptidase SpoIIGA [Oscillospiraceae bacterium]|nr:sigma-E processing peptidase SpoIIGA [Oscillospiraceae bacterium]